MFQQYYFDDIKQRVSDKQNIREIMQDVDDLIEMVEDLLKENKTLKEQIVRLRNEINDFD